MILYLTLSVAFEIATKEKHIQVSVYISITYTYGYAACKFSQISHGID